MYKDECIKMKIICTEKLGLLSFGLRRIILTGMKRMLYLQKIALRKNDEQSGKTAKNLTQAEILGYDVKIEEFDYVVPPEIKPYRWWEESEDDEQEGE